MDAPAPSTRTATSVDGETLAFEIHGTTGRTPMLTAHGLVSSVHHWMFFNPHFAAERPVIAWHYRGHGGRPAPRDPEVSVAQFADDAHAVWQASGEAPAIVVGLSFGLQVALEIYRRHPEMVRALVLICGTPGHPLDRVSSSARLRRAIAGGLRALGRQRRAGKAALAALNSTLGTRIARELAFLSGGAHRDACPPAVLDGLFAHVASLDPQLIGNVTAAYLEHDASDMLGTIAVPTLIIAADQDQLTPVSTAERMQRAIVRSELVVFPGHAHLVQVEKPREVHATIDGFLRRHDL